LPLTVRPAKGRFSVKGKGNGKKRWDAHRVESTVFLGKKRHRRSQSENE